MSLFEISGRPFMMLAKLFVSSKVIEVLLFLETS